jgi:hypothetical protein
LLCDWPPSAEPLPERRCDAVALSAERRRGAVALSPERRRVAVALLPERRAVAVAPDRLAGLLGVDFFVAGDLPRVESSLAAARVRGALLALVFRAAARVAEAAEPRLADPSEPPVLRRRWLVADFRLREPFALDWRSAITFLPLLPVLVVRL